jgi:hypothetical protein
MLRTVNGYLVHLAGIILSATLTRDELKKMLKDLEAMLLKPQNFEPGQDPLTLKAEVRSKLNNFFGYDFSTLKGFSYIIQRIVKLIETTAKTGSPDMAVISKALDRARNRWDVKFEGMTYDIAKVKAQHVLDFMDELASQPLPLSEKSKLTPEELQEMKDRGVI